MKGRLAHNGSGNTSGCHHRERGCPTGPPHGDDDVEQLGVDLLRRVLVRDRPARSPRGGAQLVVQRQLVDLHDNAVNLVFDTVPVLAVVLDKLGGTRGGRLDGEVGARGKSPRLQQPVHLTLARNRRVLPRADAVDEHPQSRQAAVHEVESRGVFAFRLLS